MNGTGAPPNGATAQRHLLFEDERQRVVAVTLPPSVGLALPWPGGGVWYLLAASHARFVAVDGQAITATLPAGVVWSDVEARRIENVGPNPLRAIAFELKTKTRQCAASAALAATKGSSNDHE